MAEEAGKAKQATSDAQNAPTATTQSTTLRPSNDSATSPPLERRTSSSQQPLRHGRKPIYPDSDAEAEGLDADVDDEELETGLPPGQGDHERSSLLGGSSRSIHGNNAVGPLDRAWLEVSKLWGGEKAYAAKLVRRRKQRRNTASASASRRNSRAIHTSSAASFSAWRHEHPFIVRSVYTIVAVLFLLLVLIAVAVSHLYLGTLKSPTPQAQSRILDESLLLKGPDRVQLLNISDEGILVRIDARLGLDPDHALDLWLGHRGEQGWWKNKERKLVEWAMGKVAGVQVDVSQVRLSEIGAAWGQQVSPSDGLSVSEFDPRDMLAFHLDPLVLPLPPLNRKIEKGHDDDEEALRPPILGNHSTPAAQHNMSPLNLTVLLKPVVPAPYIMNYAQHAIKKGFAQLDVKIESLRVRGLAKSEMHGINHGRKAGFFDVPRRIDIGQQHIRSPVQEKVPKLDDTNPDDLLRVDGYEFFEVGQDDGDDKDGGKDDFLPSMVMRALGLRAKAQATNPLGKMLQGNVRYSLPFGIFLPVDGVTPPASPKHPKHGKSQAMNAEDDGPDAAVLMAAVATEPFQLTGQKVVEVDILGRVVPPPQDEGVQMFGAFDAGQRTFKAGPAAQYTSDETTVHGSAFGDTPQQAALSNFLSRFLRGEANTVYVRGGSPFREPKSSKSSNDTDPSELPGQGSDLPDWMDSALRLVDLPISFPGAEVTELIQNVTINDLKIAPHPFEKDKLLCSGTVLGEMNMPGELSSIDVQITHMWPDILVYDGLPPDMRKSVELAEARSVSRFNMLDGALDSLKRLAFLDSSASDDKEDVDLTSKDDPKKPKPEPAPPLPDPLPEKAFGRVRPYDFAPAETFIDPSDPEGKRKMLRAVLKDVPFTVLPGRGPIFRSFTWKLVTGQGALVGIQGTSRAKIWNSGLGALQLRNLPVKGAFMLGKRD